MLVEHCHADDLNTDGIPAWINRQKLKCPIVVIFNGFGIACVEAECLGVNTYPAWSGGMARLLSFTEEEPMLAYTDTELTKAEAIDCARAIRAYRDGLPYAISGVPLNFGSQPFHPSIDEPWRYPERIGFPAEVGYLEQAMIQELRRTGHRVLSREVELLPERLLWAAREGADLSMVWPRWALWMLGELRRTDHNHAAIDAVQSLYAEWVETGNKPTHDQWEAVHSVAIKGNLTSPNAARAAADAAECGKGERADYAGRAVNAAAYGAAEGMWWAKRRIMLFWAGAEATLIHYITEAE